jgi:muramoyltetrapeptide carboxypeptidase
MRLGIIAPSSAVPAVELGLSLRRLEAEGFETRVHRQVSARHLFFAGRDEERARAFYEFALDPTLDVLWCARGGSGAIRLLQSLERFEKEGGKPPHKLLIGYSDATILMEYVRKRWGWSTLHGPMLGLREFSLLPQREWSPLVSWIRREKARAHWDGMKLKRLWSPPAAASTVEGELTGGNLTVWASVLGTPFQCDPTDKIIFFEDVGEALYRVDRVAQQIASAGHFSRARAIVLGTFQGCADSAPSVLKSRPSVRSPERMIRAPKPSELKPLRPLLPPQRTIERLFASLGECFGVPVFAGLPVGHGPGYPPLPLGGNQMSIDRDSRIRLLRWDWLKT